MGRVTERNSDPGAADPQPAAGMIGKRAPHAILAVFETGPRATWFHRQLTADGLRPACIGARHAKAARDTAPNKTAPTAPASRLFPAPAGIARLRYPGGVTDEEWAHAEPLIPSAKRMRKVFNGIMDARTGSQWRRIPKDLPPKSRVNRYFCDWAWDCVLDRIHAALCVKCREQAGREARPAAVIGSHPSTSSGFESVKSVGTLRRAQEARGSVRAAMTRAILRRTQEIKGKKRRVLSRAIVHGAGILDRGGGVLLLSAPFGRFPFLEKLFAGSAYAALARILPRVKTGIVKRWIGRKAS